MKQCVKRVYCPNCKRLVKCQEQEEGGKLQIACNRCGNRISVMQSGIWRYVKASAD